MTDPQPPAIQPGAPRGAVLLTTEQAVEAIQTKDHPEADRGSPEMDACLIGMLESGSAIAFRLPDGRLAFTVPPATN